MSVEASTKTPNNEDDFDQIIEYALYCTLKEDMDVSNCGVLRFGSLHEVSM